MQKYKDLIVKFNSSAEAISALVKIGAACHTSDFHYSEEIEKMFQTDDHISHIHVTISGLPEAIMLVSADDSSIRVLNIIPFNKSCDEIEKDVYNQIVDRFHDIIINPLFPNQDVIVTEDNTTMRDIIPNSYEALNRWVNCPGAPHAPFSHQFDLEKWFEFLCKLHKSHEELSSGDLELWLLEDKQWDEEIVNKTIVRYETERDLLKYYDKYSCND